MAFLRTYATPIVAVLVGAAFRATALQPKRVEEIDATGMIRSEASIKGPEEEQDVRQAVVGVDSTGHFYQPAHVLGSVLEDEAHLSEPKVASVALVDASIGAHVPSRRGARGGGAPSVTSSVAQWTFPATALNHHGKAPLVVVPFSVMEHVRQRGASIPVPKDWSKVEHGGFGRWLVCLVSCACVLLILIGKADSRLKVDLSSEDERLVMVRGRSCWTWFCVASTAAVAAVVFLLAYLEVVIQNIETLTHPKTEIIPDGEMSANVTTLQADNPGERAFEAGLGVIVSAVVCTMIVFFYRKHSSVQISNPLLAQFAFRGASLALVIAGTLEFGGSMLLAKLKPAGVDMQERYLPPGQAEPSAVAFTAFVWIFMLMVGVSEEFAKAIAVAQGTQNDTSQIAPEPAGFFQRCFRVLVESPHGLMLAGLSVGGGFMTIENAGYMISIVSTLPEEYEENGEKMEASSRTLLIIRVITIAARVVFNLHPWLAGITAARLAQVFFGPSSRPSIAFRDIMWAFYPAVLIHGAFDYLISSLPGSFMMILPPLVCSQCKQWFAKEWAQFDARETATAPAVGDSAEPDLAPYQLRRKGSTTMEGATDTEDTDALRSSNPGSADEAPAPAEAPVDPFLLGS